MKKRKSEGRCTIMLVLHFSSRKKLCYELRVFVNPTRDRDNEIDRETNSQRTLSVAKSQQNITAVLEIVTMKVRPPYLHHLLFFGLLWSRGCQGQNNNECIVCGGDPSALISPGKRVSLSFGLFTCAGLVGAGLVGNINSNRCAEAQTAGVEQCGCSDGEEPVETPAPVDNAPIQAPVPLPTQAPVEVPVEAPTEAPVEVPAEAPTGAPVEVPAEAPTEVPVQVPVQSPTEAPVEVPVQPPTEAPVQAPVEVPTEAPVQLPVPTPTEAPVQVPVQAPLPAPTQAPVQVPVTTPTQAPAPVDEEPPSPPQNFVCHLCGEGLFVGRPDAIIGIPSHPRLTCGQLEAVANEGSVTEMQCGFFSPFVEVSCQCTDTAPAPRPTPAPAPYFCNICGPDEMITLPDVTVQIPAQPLQTCSDWVAAGENGNIGETQCNQLHTWVRGPCGCVSTIETSAPSEYPSLPVPVTVIPPEDIVSNMTIHPNCFDNLAEIHLLEKNIENTSIRRKYVLCENTVFHMGKLHENGKILGGEPFLMVRPNVIYQCGDSGSRHNRCIFSGGDFGVVSYYGLYSGIFETVNDVEIRGITFKGQDLSAAILEAAGDITFIDCLFHAHGNLVPILIQWRGDGPNPEVGTSTRNLRTGLTTIAEDFVSRQQSQQTKTIKVNDNGSSSSNKVTHRRTEDPYEHIVTFQDCIFKENYIVENMGFPGIIENSFNSQLNIINCKFQDNNYGKENNFAPFGYAIRSFGPLNIENSCFIGNTFLKNAPVVVYGAGHSESGNYVEESVQGNDDDDDNLKCNFMALFPTSTELEDIEPSCVASSALTCSFTQPPTMSPTAAPVTPSPVAPAPTETAAIPPKDQRDRSSSTTVAIYSTSMIVIVTITTFLIY